MQKILFDTGDLVISQLVELELHSAIALKVRSREFDTATAHRVVSLFRIHLSDGYFRMVSIDAHEYDLARNWIGDFSSSLRTLDALHLATAFTNDLSLLTTDKGLARAARHFGVKHTLVS